MDQEQADAIVEAIRQCPVCKDRMNELIEAVAEGMQSGDDTPQVKAEHDQRRHQMAHIHAVLGRLPAG